MTLQDQRHSPGSLLRLFLARDWRLNLFWRLFLYMPSFFVVILLSAFLPFVIVNIFHLPEGTTIINVAGALLSIPAWLGWTFFFRRQVDRRPWAGIGLTVLRHGLPHLGLGFLLGIGTISLIFLAEFAFGWIQVVGTGADSLSGGLWTTAGTMLLLLLNNAGAGFDEEIGYRGYVFQNLGTRFPLWVAVPVSGILFSLVVHFNKLTVPFAIAAALIGILFALCRLSTQTIWLGIGWHWAFDWSQGAIFGLSHPNSPPYYGHALIHLNQQVPAWLGHDDTWLVAGLILALLLCFFGWMRIRGQHIHWRARLDEQGNMTMPTERGLTDTSPGRAILDR